MKFNEKLKNEIERFKDYVVLVEGQKDVLALKQFGFKKVYTVHKTGIPLRERIEQLTQLIDKKDRICILTDLDRQGKKIYHIIKPIIQELGFQPDSTFRGILIKSKISHVEGISNFLEKVEKMEQSKYKIHQKKGRLHRHFKKKF